MTLRCLIHGHEDVLKFEKPSLYCECLYCGRRTPGWHQEDAPDRSWLRRLEHALGLAAALFTTFVIVNPTGKLTPEAAAEVLRPHQYVAPLPEPDGPIVAVGGYEGLQWDLWQYSFQPPWASRTHGARLGGPTWGASPAHIPNGAWAVGARGRLNVPTATNRWPISTVRPSFGRR